MQARNKRYIQDCDSSCDEKSIESGRSINMLDLREKLNDITSQLQTIKDCNKGRSMSPMRINYRHFISYRYAEMRKNNDSLNSSTGSEDPG